MVLWKRGIDMLPEKKRQIGSIIGMLIMMAILVFAN